VTGAALEDAALLDYCRVVSTTTNVWKGVASGASAGFTRPGEGVVVADGSPMFTQPVVNIWTASDFIPFSIEVGQDYPDFADNMTNLIRANYRDLVAQDTATGSGSSAPEGVFTGLVGVTSSTVTLTTAGTIGAVDVRAAWSALPERMKNDPSCAWAHVIDGVRADLGPRRRRPQRRPGAWCGPLPGCARPARHDLRQAGRHQLPRPSVQQHDERLQRARRRRLQPVLRRPAHRRRLRRARAAAP